MNQEPGRLQLVGEDDDEFRPVAAGAGEREGALQILFFGTYVPLHGIRFILEAAERLLAVPGPSASHASDPN